MIRVIALRILESFFRRPWRNLLPMVLFMVLGLIYVLTKTPEYMTTGVLHVQDGSVLNSLTEIGDTGYAWVTPAQATMDQVTELLQTDSFVRALISQTALEEEMSKGPDEVWETMELVREDVWAESTGDTNVAFTATHTDPVVSLQLTEAAIETYLQFNINRSQADSTAARDFFTQLVSEYEAEKDAATQELSDYLLLHPEPIRGDRPAIEELQITNLTTDVVLAQERWQDARGKDEAARLAVAQSDQDIRQTYRVIDTPRLPEKPNNTSKKSMAVSLVAFTVVGGLLSVLSIIAGALIDRTFRYPVDVHQILELPVLAAVPVGEVYERTVEQEQFAYRMPTQEEINAQRKRARLIPLVEPPTLIIMPDEVNEIERITRERNRHGTNATTYGGQERVHANGFADRNVAPNTGFEDLPTTVLGRGGDR